MQFEFFDPKNIYESLYALTVMKIDVNWIDLIKKIIVAASSMLIVSFLGASWALWVSNHDQDGKIAQNDKRLTVLESQQAVVNEKLDKIYQKVK